MLMISPRQNKNGVPTTAGSLLLFLASISLVQISLSLLLVTSFTIQHSTLLRVSQQQQQQQHGLYYPSPTGRTAPAPVTTPASATTPVTTTTQLSLFGSNMFGTNDNKKLKDNELATYPSLYTNGDDRTVDGTFDSLSTYLDSWSQLFESSGKGGVLKLTTPVKVLPLELVASSVSDRNGNGNENDDDSVRVVASNGLRLIFQNVDTGYSNKKDEQQQQQKQDNGDDKKKKKPKLQGGVEIVVEKINNDVRVRARRCNFNDETIIKEMSEETIVKELEKAISVWKQQQQK